MSTPLTPVIDTVYIGSGCYIRTFNNIVTTIRNTSDHNVKVTIKTGRLTISRLTINSNDFLLMGDICVPIYNWYDFFVEKADQAHNEPVH